MCDLEGRGKRVLTVGCTGDSRICVGCVKAAMSLGGAVQGSFVSAYIRTEATLGLDIDFCLRVNMGE